MSIALLSIFFGCSTGKKSNPVTTAQPSTVSEQQKDTTTVEGPEIEGANTKPLVTISAPTGAVYLIDSEGNRIEASQATPGQYNAVWTITMKDRNGTRESDVPIGNVQLTTGETKHIECIAPLNEAQDEVTLSCAVKEQ